MRKSNAVIVLVLTLFTHLFGNAEGTGSEYRKRYRKAVTGCDGADSTVCLNAKEAKLCCYGHYHSLPVSYTWYHRNGTNWQLLKQNNHYSFADGSRYSSQNLIISHVGQKDAGKYLCSISDKMELASAVTALDVVHCPELELNVTVNQHHRSRRIPLNELKPGTEAVNLDVPVTLGAEAEFDCSIVTEDGTIVNTKRNPSISFKRNLIAALFSCSTSFRETRYNASFNFYIEPEEPTFITNKWNEQVEM